MQYIEAGIECLVKTDLYGKTSQRIWVFTVVTDYFVGLNSQFYILNCALSRSRLANIAPILFWSKIYKLIARLNGVFDYFGLGAVMLII